MLSAGIVGLPNVGKSTLFNAVTRTHKAPAENYPFCTIDPNVGVVTVPDFRLGKIAEISRSKKITPTAIEFVDIAGLVKGASAGEGLGNQFLHHIREVEAIVQVVRCFENPEEKAIARGFFLLTSKPTIFACNVAESDLAAISKGDSSDPTTRHVNLVEDYARHHFATEAVVISAQIESELADLGEDEAAQYLRSLGVEDTGVHALIRAVYHLLGLRTFFTTGEKETRAWTIHEGDKAPAAAGAIHSDFERGFIAAETVHCDDLIAAGSFAKAREAGKIRMEGKDYEVRDGDVIFFRFNV